MLSNGAITRVMSRTTDNDAIELSFVAKKATASDMESRMAVASAELPATVNPTPASVGTAVPTSASVGQNLLVSPPAVIGSHNGEIEVKAPADAAVKLAPSEVPTDIKPTAGNPTASIAGDDSSMVPAASVGANESVTGCASNSTSRGAMAATDAQATDVRAAEALDATDGAFPSVANAIEAANLGSGIDATIEAPGVAMHIHKDSGTRHATVEDPDHPAEAASTRAANAIELKFSSPTAELAVMTGVSKIVRPPTSSL